MIEELKDFRNFVYLVHKYIDLPHPTDFQYKLCDNLQDSPDRLLITAFRGASKSHLSALYALYLLYWDLDTKVLVISATQQRAADFVSFCKKVMLVCPFLQHLSPSKEQRDLSYSFDVSGCSASQTHSLEAKGVTSQITGLRANIIICDDLEIATTQSSDARDKLENLSNEFESILLPEGKIIYLGTPHSHSSIYNNLPKKGFKVKKYPVYDSKGNSIEPSRFCKKEIEQRRKGIGESAFQLQFMLNTSLADKDLFPLHLSDLIISDDFNDFSCKEEYIRTDKEYNFFIRESKGLDKLYCSESKGFEVPYIKKILALDPAGSGKDTFSYVVLATRNSYIFILEMGGWDKFDNSTVSDIVTIAKRHKINEIICETNFGDDLILNVLKPNINIPIVPVKNHIQKEKRIISTLEPILNSHKLICNKSILKNNDFWAQFCNLTSDKGSLKHDDYIDVLAIGCKQLAETITINVGLAKQKEYEERIQQEIDSMVSKNHSNLWSSR